MPLLNPEDMTDIRSRRTKLDKRYSPWDTVHPCQGPGRVSGQGDTVLKVPLRYTPTEASLAPV